MRFEQADALLTLNTPCSSSRYSTPSNGLPMEFKFLPFGFAASSTEVIPISLMPYPLKSGYPRPLNIRSVESFR